MSQAHKYATTRKPKRPTRYRSPPHARILTWSGVVILVGIVLVVAWHVVGTAGGTKSGLTGAPSAQSTATYPDVYWQTIREQVAAGLHLTVDQLETKLTTPTGNGPKGPIPPTFTEIAAQQGVDAAQLRAIEVNALTRAGDVLVQHQVWTQHQADQRIQVVNNESDTQVNATIISAFLSH
jgi:hypothetical protein